MHDHMNAVVVIPDLHIDCGFINIQSYHHQKCNASQLTTSLSFYLLLLSLAFYLPLRLSISLSRSLSSVQTKSSLLHVMS